MSDYLNIQTLHRVLREGGYISFTSRLKWQERFRDHHVYESHISESGVSIYPLSRYTFSIPKRNEILADVQRVLKEAGLNCKASQHDILVPWTQTAGAA